MKNTICDDVKEKTLILLITNSEIAEQHKAELIDYVRSRSAEKQACFRLGQMDVKESVVACLLDESKVCDGVISSTLRAAADYFKEMEVI